MRNGGSFGRTVMRTDSVESLRQRQPCGVFAEDANFVHIFWGQLDGRAAIEAAHRNIFETIYRGSYASFMQRSIGFLRPDVAVVFARAHVKFKEGNEARNRNPPKDGRPKGTGKVANRGVPKYEDL